MEKEQKLDLLKIILSFVIVAIAKILKLDANIEFALMIIAYLIVGFEVLKKAITKIIKYKTKNIFDECFLMSIATIGAFIIGEWSEAVFVMAFYQLGEFFEDFIVDKSKDSIKSLLDIRPDFVHIEKENELIDEAPENVKIGDIIIVKAGERVPIDGIICEGEGTFDTKTVTGESIPRQCVKDDFVASGYINLTSLIKIKTTKEFKNSTASKIIEMVESATEKKAKSEKFITEFAKIYTPIVCLLSLLIFVIPSLYSIIIKNDFTNITTYGYRALTMLVISCPCALVVSIPLGFFASIGCASRKGILIKGSNLFESLSHIKNICFDKTGTMTKGVYEVIAIHHNIIDNDKLLEYAAHAEYYSNHPIAKSIIRAYDKKIDKDRIKNQLDMSGYGISCEVDDKKILIGNSKLMEKESIDYIECTSVGTVVHVAIDNQYEGHILISDIIKENAKETINELSKINVNTYMLTGDRELVAKDVASKIGIKEVHYELMPEDKLDILNNIIETTGNKKNKTAFVGDGINDAPCISRADVGVAMGVIGQDAAIEVADVVIMDDEPRKIYKIVKIGKKTMKVIYENIFGSIGIKVMFIVLSAVGISNMWLAVFADVGVLILAILNSLRLSFDNE